MFRFIFVSPCSGDVAERVGAGGGARLWLHYTFFHDRPSSERSPGPSAADTAVSSDIPSASRDRVTARRPISGQTRPAS